MFASAITVMCTAIAAIPSVEPTHAEPVYIVEMKLYQGDPLGEPRCLVCPKMAQVAEKKAIVTIGEPGKVDGFRTTVMVLPRTNYSLHVSPLIPGFVEFRPGEEKLDVAVELEVGTEKPCRQTLSVSPGSETKWRLSAKGADDQKWVVVKVSKAVSVAR